MDFQTFQPVRVNNEALEHHGQAGTVRSLPHDHTDEAGATSTVVDVQLDGIDGLLMFAPADLTPL